MATEDSVKLFLGQLPFSWGENEIRELMGSFGEVEEIFIITNRATGQSKDADRAIAELHGKKTLSTSLRPMQVSYADGEESKIGERFYSRAKGLGSHNLSHPFACVENKLFVGQIPHSAGEDQLRELFSQYGEVVDIFLMKKPDGSHRGAAFVKMGSRGAAEAAIASLDEKMTMNGGMKPLRVHYADSQAKKRKREEMRGGVGRSVSQFGMQGGLAGYGFPGMLTPFAGAAAFMGGAMGAIMPGRGVVANQVGSTPAQNQGVKLFVGGIPLEATEDQIHNVFSWYGQILQVFIMRHRDGNSKGSAFIVYSNEAEAQAAIQGADGMMMAGSTRPLVVKHANKRESVPGITGGLPGVMNGLGALSGAVSPYAAAAGGAATPGEGCKLFVGGIPPQAAEPMILSLFSMFGVVTDVFLLRKSDGSSKGAGFVTMASRDMAETAIRSCHGIVTMPGGHRKLVVKHQGEDKSGSNDNEPDGAENPSNGDDGFSGGPMRLFVGGVPHGVGDIELSALFSLYGKVNDVFVMRKPSGESKGSAFITMANDREGANALKAINQVITLPGGSRPLLVNQATLNEKRDRVDMDGESLGKKQKTEGPEDGE